MNADKLAQIIQDCCNDISFSYNGKPSGITPEVQDAVPTYTAWHGDNIKTYHSVQDVMEDKFYSGKSLMDLVNIIDFNVS